MMNNENNNKRERLEDTSPGQPSKVIDLTETPPFIHRPLVDQTQSSFPPKKSPITTTINTMKNYVKARMPHHPANQVSARSHRPSTLLIPPYSQQWGEMPDFMIPPPVNESVEDELREKLHDQENMIKELFKKIDLQDKKIKELEAVTSTTVEAAGTSATTSTVPNINVSNNV